MKLTKYLFPVVVFAAAMTSCDTCDLEPVIPPVKAPVDTTPANTTILELKQAYWTSDFKCVNQIGLNDRGDSILIRGRVISTDITGNLYQQVVLRDETAAVAIRVRNNNLYRVYPYGSELLINVTGMYIGMYGNGMQIGGKTPGEDTPQTLNEDVFKAAVKANGWPDTSLAQPVPVDGEFLKSMASSTEGKQEWQSQLVTIDGVTFDEPGAKFAAGTTSIISVYGRTDSGQLQMRFSGRSSFANMTIPSGSGSVTGILSYYNKDWQLIPCTLDDLKGFDGSNGGSEGPTVMSRATSISNGQYAIWFAEDKVAKAFSDGSNYGWLKVTSCTPAANGDITVSADNLFTFTQESKGWIIMDSNSQYLYQDGIHESFQVSKTLDPANDMYFWTVTFQTDGTASIVNVGTGGTVRYSTEFDSCGAYADLSKGTASYLYQPVK